MWLRCHKTAAGDDCGDRSGPRDAVEERLTNTGEHPSRPSPRHSHSLYPSDTKEAHPLVRARLSVTVSFQRRKMSLEGTPLSAQQSQSQQHSTSLRAVLRPCLC